MKLYQNALKLHSQGPDSYEDAEAAYKVLFNSDIFAYPESLSLSKQVDLYGDADELNEASGALETGELDLPLTSTDEAPNTLHHILYLAYKNRGQFLLDSLKNRLHQAEKGHVSANDSDLRSLVQQTVVASLSYLVEAIDRDEADLHLWRLISTLSHFLKSKRLARYCLEAVLDSDDASLGGWPETLGLEESFAVEQLRTLLRELGDNLSEKQTSTLFGKQTRLLSSLKKHVDPYPFLLRSTGDSKDERSLSRLYNVVPDRQEITVPMRSWAGVGKAILLVTTNISQGVVEPSSGTAYTVRLPPREIPHEYSSSKGASEGVETAIEPSAAREATSRQDVVDTSTGGIGNEMSPEMDTKDGVKTPTAPEMSNISAEPLDADQVHSADSSIQVGSSEIQIPSTDRADAPEPLILESPRTMSLPTRKRSSEAAGLPETMDLGRSKSKRIKARVSTTEVAAEDLTQHYEEQLREHTQADQILFEFVGGLLAKMDANQLGDFSELKAAFVSSTQDAGPSADSNDPLKVVIQDLRALLISWGVDKSTSFLKVSSHVDAFEGANGSRNLIAFLENSKRVSPQVSNLPKLLEDDGLEEFMHKADHDWLLLDQLALAWIQELLAPKIPNPGHDEQIASVYECYLWTSLLKETVVQVLVQKDEFIYSTLRDQTQRLEKRLLATSHALYPKVWKAEDEILVRLIQHIFEIHIDIYERITNPSSVVDLDTRTMQCDRLGRWAALAHDALSQRPQGSSESDNLALRFMWSTVLFVNSTDASARDYVISCFQDLKRMLAACGSPVIKLENNAAMPEISTEAADREISCLTTMDFFLGIFDAENDDPLSLIESLEPILQASIEEKEKSRQPQAPKTNSLSNIHEGESSPSGNTESIHYSTDSSGSQVNDLVQYFNKASLTLRLFLWQRLGKAYEAIEYFPQVLACNFRRMELIVEHLQTPEFRNSSTQTRQLNLLGWLSDLEHLITSTLTIALNDSHAFEFMDMMLLRTSMTVLSVLQRVIHVYVLWIDSVRVGQHTVPQTPRGSALTQFSHSMAKFDQMQVKAWMLQFLLLKEAMVQAPELYQDSKDDSIDYLNLVHYVLGLRQLCGLCNKGFLKLMKTEMIQYRASGKASDSWEWDFAQVVFDIHGIKVCPSFGNIRDHGCTPEVVDRATALELMDYVIVQANRLSVKDLAKSELKPTIDRLQQAIKAPKASNASSLNKRAISHFLRSPINPLDMYRALKGMGELSSIPVDNQFSAIADKGWYFLLGHMSLARFRSQKRTIPGPLDDLDLAMTFFRHDLELGMEKWETWYRLAQVYDTRIEENTTWSAEKINNGMEELKALQRSAIHCYTMAVATAVRSADASFEAVGKMADLYADFAMRIYASSREPFSMKAFGLQNFERHFSNPSKGMYKQRPFRELQLYSAWNFARVMLRWALADKPNNWM